MQTRAQTSGARSSPPRAMDQPVRPNSRRLRQLVHHSILNMEERIATLEAKEPLTDSHRQAVMRISKMLESMCSEFKAYHYEIVASLETDEDAAREQVVFDEHQSKAMEFIDRLGDLLAKPQPDVPSIMSGNNRLVDRQLESLEDSARNVRRVAETPDRVDTHVLTGCLDEIKSLKAKLEGLEKEILSLDDYEGRKGRASHIERDLFDLRVVVSRRMEESSKKESKGDKFGVPAMAGVNLPRIEIPTFDGNILNWRLF